MNEQDKIGRQEAVERIDTAQEVTYDPPPGLWRKIGYVAAFLGPGAVTAAAAMGPGTMSSVITAGSHMGYPVFWVILISGPMGGLIMWLACRSLAATGETGIDTMRRVIGRPLVDTFVWIWVATWYLAISIQGTTLRGIYEEGWELVTGSAMPFAGALILTFATLAVIAFLWARGFKRAITYMTYCLVGLGVLFLINSFIARPDFMAMLRGLVPSFPPKPDVAFAGVIGGAGTGSSLFMAQFAFRDRGWMTKDHYAFIGWDTIFFRGILMTVFSVGAYLSAAAVMYPEGVVVTSAMRAGIALIPLAGPAAGAIMIVGLWLALFTTIGGMCAMGAYTISNLLNWGATLDEKRTRLILLAGILLTVLGGFTRLAHIPMVVWSMGMLTLTGPIFYIFFFIVVNRRDVMGEMVATPWVNAALVVLLGINSLAVINWLDAQLGLGIF